MFKNVRNNVRSTVYELAYAVYSQPSIVFYGDSIIYSEAGNYQGTFPV